MKRINIEISEDLHTNAKVIAVLKDITMQQFLVEAITEAVDKDKRLLDKLKGGK
jgi:predicted HicB family RNase H-like nuclease